MSAHIPIDETQYPQGRTITFLILFLPCLWVFFGTIDGPAVNLGVAGSSVIYKASKALDPQHSIQLEPLSFEICPRDPLPVHASFLLFDFKQNLRRWPNVAGDISRSPPFFHS
jgi:hypothetical protein